MASKVPLNFRENDNKSNSATSKAIHLIYGKEKSKNSMVGYGRIGFPNEEEKEATREIEGLLSECLILDSFR